jgi:D-amino-acid oxidase
MAMADVVVIGGGVIGLTTAVCLAEEGLQVQVRSAGPPASTTSAAAGAICGPALIEPAGRVAGWNAATLAEFQALAEDPETGVRLIAGTMVSRTGGLPSSPSAAAPPAVGTELPPQITSLPGFQPCPPEDLPDGFLAGFRATIPAIDMPRYLDYLATRFAAAGGALQTRPVKALAEAAQDAPVVVNCTGVAARDLVPDPAVRPVRGQHVIVENPGLDEYFVEGGAPGPEFVAYIPHGRHVVLGGVAGVDDWRLDPDPVIAERILARCTAIEPRLKGARILGHSVGLRPDRTGGVRLERERPGYLHNYGHGSVGVSLSWGCAREVVSLVTAPG